MCTARCNHDIPSDEEEDYNHQPSAPTRPDHKRFDSRRRCICQVPSLNIDDEPGCCSNCGGGFDPTRPYVLRARTGGIPQPGPPDPLGDLRAGESMSRDHPEGSGVSAVAVNAKRALEDTVDGLYGPSLDLWSLCSGLPATGRLSLSKVRRTVGFLHFSLRDIRSQLEEGERRLAQIWDFLEENQGRAQAGVLNPSGKDGGGGGTVKKPGGGVPA